MLRHNHNTVGSITMFYPGALKPVLVLHADFRNEFAVYRINRWQGEEILFFSIDNNGNRIDLTTSSDDGTLGNYG